MYLVYSSWYFFFFFNDTATTEIYTLSLHDALPIFAIGLGPVPPAPSCHLARLARLRSEEHTSELQSRFDIVCRLLLEKKKIYIIRPVIPLKPQYQSPGNQSILGD